MGTTYVINRSMCNTCCTFDECETYETHFKVQLLSLFLPSISCRPLSLSLPFSFPPLKHPSKLLIQGLSWRWSSFFHGLFPSGWCLPSPLLLYPLLHLHGGKSPLKDLIEAQRSSLHRSSTSKLPSSGNQSTREVGDQAVLGRQGSLTTPWLTGRHG